MSKGEMADKLTYLYMLIEELEGDGMDLSETKAEVVNKINELSA